ncbi:MAG TPA: ATP-binding protein [Candidatus Limnocylindrales bacterium]|nr:ATP-binding protein [Candidatus Limnocylindrales bacterium]
MPELVRDRERQPRPDDSVRRRFHVPQTLEGRILALGTLVTVVLIALSQANAWGLHTVWEHAHWNIASVSATLAVVVATARAEGRDRLVRAGAAGALGLWSLYTATWSVEVFLGIATFPSFADVFGLLIVVPIGVFVVATVRGRLTRAEESAVYLDVALVGAAALAATLVLIGGAAYTVGGAASVIVFLYPLLFLTITGAGVVTLVAIRHPVRLTGGLPLLGGAGVIALAFFGWLVPAALGESTSGTLASHLFSVGVLLAGLGGATWREETATGPRYTAAATWLSRTIGPIAASITLLALFREAPDMEPLEPYVRLTVVITGVMFIVRQGLLLRERTFALNEIRALQSENRRLVDELRAELAERIHVQDRLVAASRMAAVGELAAGVAHEINNPLTGVLGYSELLLDDLDTGDPRRADVQTIRTEAMRARAIVRALRDFARPRPPQPIATDLRELVARTIDLVRLPLERSGVMIAESYGEMPAIELDQQSIQQVVLNVATNAMQAMPDGGTLRVRTAVHGDEAVITIADDGVGMEEAVAAQAFVPFFSGRRASGAPGLGLSVSLGLVESHHGNIRLHSQVGVGTTVEIRLPVVASPPVEAALVEAFSGVA